MTQEKQSDPATCCTAAYWLAKPSWEWPRIQRITNGLADFIEDEELRRRVLVKLTQVDEFLRTCEKYCGTPGERYEPDGRRGGYPASSRGMNAKAHRGTILGAVARYGGACRALSKGWKSGSVQKKEQERRNLIAVLAVSTGDNAIHAGTRFRTLRADDPKPAKKGRRDAAQFEWDWDKVGGVRSWVIVSRETGKPHSEQRYRTPELANQRRRWFEGQEDVATRSLVVRPSSDPWDQS